MARRLLAALRPRGRAWAQIVLDMRARLGPYYPRRGHRALNRSAGRQKAGRAMREPREAGVGRTQGSDDCYQKRGKGGTRRAEMLAAIKAGKAPAREGE